jgi:hypothetical protein
MIRCSLHLLLHQPPSPPPLLPQLPVQEKVVGCAPC